MKIKPFKIERFYALHEFTAKYLLCSSDCEAMTVGDLLLWQEGAAEEFNSHWLGYTQTKGNPKLRACISAIYENQPDESVLVCSGAQEPIFLFCNAILNRGDEVIIQFPCYQSVESVPESLGCVVRRWEVSYKDSKPAFCIDTLEKLITVRTRVIFLNSPHNPTGYHFDAGEQAQIIELARKRNTLIFCDEVYRELEHKLHYRIPAIADVYENGVSLGVMSKAYGLAGLRIGWLASKRLDILEKVAILKEYTTICNSSPSEFLSLVALQCREKILERNLGIVNFNLPLLNDFFNRYSNLFTWRQPIAGPIGFVKMNFDMDNLAFAESVMQQQSVLLLPGEIFDYKGFFRIGFGRRSMPEALKRFEVYVNQNLCPKL